MLHPDLGRCCDLLRGTAPHRRKARRCHRTGHPDLALTAHFGARDRGTLLVKQADAACRQQEPPRLFARLRPLVAILPQHGWDDPRRSIGGGGNDPAASGVFLVHGHREEVEPVEQHFGLVGGAGEELAPQFRRSAAHLEAAGKAAFLRQPSLDASEHRFHQEGDPGESLVFAAPCTLVCKHQCGNVQTVGAAQRKQFSA